MNKTRSPLSPKMTKIEELLDNPSEDGFAQYLRQQKVKEATHQGLDPAQYSFYLQRNHPEIGNEVIRLGGYDEETLYGHATSANIRFQKTAKDLAARAVGISEIAAKNDMAEFDFQCSLFWPELGELTEYLGASDEISEIVAELRTIRLQFAKKDTTPDIMRTLAQVLEIASSTIRLKTEHVDQIIDQLESAGGDPFFPDSFSKEEG